MGKALYSHVQSLDPEVSGYLKDQSWVLSCFLCIFCQLETFFSDITSCHMAMQMTLKCTVTSTQDILPVYRVHLEVLNAAWMSWVSGW